MAGCRKRPLTVAARLEARRTFVVDPIDGTRGFLEGKTHVVRLRRGGRGGAAGRGVLECPATRGNLLGLAGQGAFQNGARLRVRDPAARAGNLRPKAASRRCCPTSWRQRARRIGHIPSLAYRLAMIADAALDATFVKPNAHDWDIAAADLILREAGGGCSTRTARRRPMPGGRYVTACWLPEAAACWR